MRREAKIRAGRSRVLAVRMRAVAAGIVLALAGGASGVGGQAMERQAAAEPVRAAATGEMALGRQVYHRGVGEDGREILAAVGEQAVELPASALPCASCHGDDGRTPVGQGGTLMPPELTREAMARPASGAAANGRDRPAYEPRTLKRAVTMGLDPASNRLDTAMPRYRLTHAEAAALVAYLGTLGEGEAGGESSDGGQAETDGSAAVATDPPDGGSSVQAAGAPAGPGRSHR
jgi:cytochrome c1